MATMDEDQFERFLNALTSSSNSTTDAVQAFVNAAAADRETSATNTARLAAAMVRGTGGTDNRRDYPQRTDGFNQIMKVEKEALSWAKENPFDPVKNSAELWGADIKEKLVSRAPLIPRARDGRVSRPGHRVHHRRRRFHHRI